MLDSFSESPESLKMFLLENNIRIYLRNEILIDENLNGSDKFNKCVKGVIKATNELVKVKSLDRITLDEEGSLFFTILIELNKIKNAMLDKIENFLGIYQPDEEHSDYGLIFSFIEGEALRDILDGNFKNVSIQMKCQISINLVEIVTTLHSKGIIHGCLNPSNVIVNRDGKLFVLGFEKQKLTASNNLKYSVRYLPKEAFEDDKFGPLITPKFDVWSIGCILTEIFSGVIPWSNKYKDHHRIMLALLKDVKFNENDFPFPKGFKDIYPEVYEICRSCLIKDANSRYTCTMLLKNLKEIEELYN